MTRLGSLLVLLVVIGRPLTSQTLRFEVASIRPSANRAPVADYVFLPGGQFRAVNATVEELILAAFDIARFRVAGGPDWVRSVQYDVQTRGAGADVTMEETRAMLRTLLEERFHLRTHIAPRGVPLYRLALARRDGRTGPGLRPSSLTSCVDRGPLPINVPPGAPPSCGRLLGNVGRLSGWRVPISMLAARIERFVDRPVLNETELSGQSFDLELEWAPEVSSNNSGKPGLSTALVEQLGLKLEATKGTAEVLVIDSVEQPTPD
jgi:uncharacterized protein (TIGR03435 family)